jgi:hypothetical protein
MRSITYGVVSDNQFLREQEVEGKPWLDSQKRYGEPSTGFVKKGGAIRAP